MILRLVMLMAAILLAKAEPPAGSHMAAGEAEFAAAYRAWDASRFAAAAELFRQAGSNAPAATSLHWLGVAEFHRMLQLRDSLTNAAEADAALESALEALNAAVKLDGADAENHALLGTLYGMKIGGSLVRALRFGPRVAKHQEAALKAGPANPRVQYLLGMCQFHTAKNPAAMRQALATLSKAEQLFAAEAAGASPPPGPRWGQDSCLTFAGLAQESLGRLPEAAESFRKALALRPADHIALAGLARVSEKK